MSANQGERDAWETWNDRASRVIAGGCLTFSKSRRYYTKSQPSHVRSACGNNLIAHDGSIIFDTVSGLGANLVTCENSYSLPSTLEVEFSESLLRRIPFERVKIVKTGTEACMAALRYMRAEKPGKKILSTGYHGWGNEFISCEPNCVGCCAGDVSKCGSIGEVIDLINGDVDTIGGVIIEPVSLEASSDHIALLRRLSNACKSRGVLLCFDEVITGYRFPHYTVAQTYGIMPDVLVMGKAIGGGHPLGLVLGPASIMDRHGVFVSGTFAGDTTTLAAAKRIVDGITTDELRRFWDVANNFHSKMLYVCGSKMEIAGYGTRMVFGSKLDDGLTVAKYMQEMYRRHRILIGPVMFPRLSWGAMEYTKIIDATEDVMRTIDSVTLDGDKPSPIFKRNS